MTTTTLLHPRILSLVDTSRQASRRAAALSMHVKTAPSRDLAMALLREATDLERRADLCDRQAVYLMSRLHGSQLKGAHWAAERDRDVVAGLKHGVVGKRGVFEQPFLVEGCEAGIFR